jgi:CheY-like chemotaxis protein
MGKNLDRRKIILYIEDNESMRERYSFLLEEGNFLVKKFASAHFAVKEIEEGLEYDYVLVDYSLPGGFTPEAIFDISKKIHPNVPISTLSLYSSIYSTKPFTAKFLKSDLYEESVVRSIQDYFKLNP